jgi:hypothetical protein
MEKIKVIVDQDARGPGTSDMQAILVFLQRPDDPSTSLRMIKTYHRGHRVHGEKNSASSVLSVVKGI